MNIFIDHNLSHVVARTLDAYLQSTGAGYAIALEDKFDRDIEDEDWINELAYENRREGTQWCFFTGDRQIIRKDEKDALIESGLPGFFLKKALSEAKLHLQLARIFSIIPEIQDKTARNYNAKRTGSIKYYEIPIKGRLEEIFIR